MREELRPRRPLVHPRHRVMPRSALSDAALAIALLLLAPAAVRAELVILRGGDVLKVASFEVGPESARLVLPSGGTLTLPIHRIERIVDDEIEASAPEHPGTSDRVAATVPLGYREGEPVPATPFGELIYQTARSHGVSPALVAAMMRVESAFNPQALSHKGARGLMQLMPATAARFGVTMDELYQPERNLEAGVRYIAWLRGRFDDDPLRVVAAYNAGEGAVDRHGGVPPFRETQGYVKKVLGLLGTSPDAVGAMAFAVSSGGS